MYSHCSAGFSILSQLLSLRSFNSLNLGTILPLYSGTFNLVFDFYSLCSQNQHNLGAPPEHYFKVCTPTVQRDSQS